MVMRVATFFPFQTTYYLNGHNFIERELNRARVGFRKNDNAFLAIDDVAALQAAADRLSPDIIRERLDYWTLILGPKFSVKERKRGKAVALLRHLANRILPQLHLQTELSHPQTVRARLRTRTVAADSPQDYRDLRRPPTPQAARQARHRHRSDRAWPSRLPRLLQTCLPEAVRKVRNVLAQ